MTALIDSIIDFLNTNFFGMTFGLIISIILFFIDRAGKNRQEESLRRQDEALDIILEQVSKVNIFQTRTLSLAIDGLNKEFSGFKTDIDLIKQSLIPSEQNFSQKSEIISPSGISKQEQGIASVQEEPTQFNFGDVLSKQLNTFIGQIKSNISDLAKKETEKRQKDLYKVKKGLEFDIKDLMNFQAMIEGLNPQPNVRQNEKTNNMENDAEISNPERKTKENLFDKNNAEKNEQRDPKQTLLREQNLKKEKNSNLFKNFDKDLDNLESVQDIVKFTENIIKKFEFINPVQNENETEKDSLKVKRKVKPTKIISNTDADNPDSPNN